MTKDKTQYIKNWLFRANGDIAVIASLVNSGAKYYTSSICFHARQASEKLLKAFLAYHDIDFPRTHDLDYLLLECQKIDQKAFDIDFKSLTDFGGSVRYPDDFFIPDENEADLENMRNKRLLRLLEIYKQKALKPKGKVKEARVGSPACRIQTMLPGQRFQNHCTGG